MKFLTKYKKHGFLILKIEINRQLLSGIHLYSLLNYACIGLSPLEQLICLFIELI